MIILCGFMGAGKTSKGKLLASELNADYCDLDDLIVAETGISIKDIFTESGESEFRRIESEVLRGAIGKDMVLSLGGGTLDREENRKICAHAVVFYLNTPFETCYSRIAKSERPLVQSKSKAELRELYEKRAKIYEKCADFQIDTETFGEDKQVIADQMAKLFKTAKINRNTEFIE